MTSSRVMIANVHTLRVFQIALVEQQWTSQCESISWIRTVANVFNDSMQHALENRRIRCAGKNLHLLSRLLLFLRRISSRKIMANGGYGTGRVEVFERCKGGHITIEINATIGIVVESTESKDIGAIDRWGKARVRGRSRGPAFAENIAQCLQVTMMLTDLARIGRSDSHLMEVFLGIATDRVVELGYNIFPSSAVSVNVGEGFIFEAGLSVVLIKIYSGTRILVGRGIRVIESLIHLLQRELHQVSLVTFLSPLVAVGWLCGVVATQSLF
jgi:hypothetical protein